LINVVNLKIEPYDVYIGRGSKWGNPFYIGKDNTRMGVIAKYKEYILSRHDLLKHIVDELDNKTLGCYCKPLPCHGDILAEIVKLRRHPMNLANILNYNFPEHTFEARDSNRVTKGHKAVCIDGKFYGGDYTVMEEDINSYYALDVEKEIIKMFSHIIFDQIPMGHGIYMEEK